MLQPSGLAVGGELLKPIECLLCIFRIDKLLPFRFHFLNERVTPVETAGWIILMDKTPAADTDFTAVDIGPGGCVVCGPRFCGFDVAHI